MQKLVVQLFSVVIAEIFFLLTVNALQYPSHNRRYVNHRNWRLLPHNECGITKYHYAIRILKGDAARLGQFPWMVGLMDSDGPFLKPIRCSGSLINDRYVVTAGHCMIPNKTRFAVLGEHKQSSYVDCDHYQCNPPALLMRIETTVCHAGYNFPTNDICLLRLDQKITFNDAVRPICLPTYTNLRKDNFDGQVLEIAGWGRTTAAPLDQDTRSDYLKRTGVQVVPKGECSRWPPPLLDSQICVRGDDGRGSCHGDSGGPLMASSVSSPTGRLVTVLVGVTSFGKSMQNYDPNWPTCGNHITVFTRVSDYIDWILDNIR